MRIRYYCPDCLTARNLDTLQSGEFSCGKCGRPAAARFESFAGPGGIERCAFCGGRAFFLQ